MPCGSTRSSRPKDGSTSPNEGTGASLAADGRGLWVLANLQIGTSRSAAVWRIDLDSLELTWAGISPYIQSPATATIGPGGIWVASATDHAVLLLEPAELDMHSEDELGTPATGAPGVTSIRVTGQPTKIAVDTKGNVWAIDPLSGVVWRVDPLTKSIVRTIEVRRGLGGIAVNERGVWLTVDAP